VFVSVATGFPSGQTPLHTRLEEIKYAVSAGASEIDVVINRSYVLCGNWKG
jgi:deoxyribose-phosphate aldolase